MHLEPQEQEQRVMAMANEFRVKGLTYRAIAKRLKARGHLNRNGKLFHPVQIMRMVS